MSDLRTSLLEGIPYYGMDEHVNKAELDFLGQAVEQAGMAAHQALYEGFYAGDPNVVVLDDPYSDQNGQYISFAAQGPCYGSWDPLNQNTDIGIRGANPDFGGILNPATVIHADNGAVEDYYKRRAPGVLLEALDAVATYNGFIVQNVAIPFLGQVAEVFGHDPAQYVEKFFPAGERWRTISRAMLYHLDAPEGMRPVSPTDGRELLIKEHCDKSAFTIDSRQTSEGLQYFINGQWVDAGTAIACFPGSADDALGSWSQGNLSQATRHRAVLHERAIERVSPELLACGLVRIALPTFVSLSDANARVVQSNSAQTHPSLAVSA